MGCPVVGGYVPWMPALFAADRPEPDNPPGATDSAAPWTVARLAGAVQSALQEGLPTRIRVVGEISNLSARNHWFFSLKDAEASIRAVMFASAARRVGFEARNGLSVVATGRIDYYGAQGSVQLYVDALEAVGEGELEAAFRRLATELRAEGLFAPERKRPLPACPRAIAVVTSRSAAALQDVRDTARRRWPGCRLVLVDVRVQGPAAAPGIVSALRSLSRNGPGLGLDAVLLTRGGGSIEDLWAFNEPEVVRAVAECSLPTVAAIGHETDTTLAELAADARCATPTQATMVLVPDAAQLAEQAAHLERRLSLAVQRHLEVAASRVRAAARHPLFSEPARLVADARGRVATAEQRLGLAVPRRLAAAADRLAAAERTLVAIGPQRVLARGYTLTTDAEGRLLRNVAEAGRAAALVTRFADGELRSVPEGRAPARPATPAQAPPPPPPPRRRKRKASDTGPSLFGDQP